MPDLSIVQIQNIAVHFVGNKSHEEVLKLSDKPMPVGDERIMALLHKYFTTPFKSEELFNLYHESDISLNAVYSCVSAIFDNPGSLLEQSQHLANHLYDSSVHPKIKGGEFYVAYLTNCIVENEKVDAIGLFKSESKETFLKVQSSERGFDVKSEEGININKLDKGCIIYNLEKENGYLVSVVDNVNKSAEALFWKDDFLKVLQRKDNYQFTQNYLSVCKSFVTEKLPEAFEVSRADQAEFLNKSVQYFKKNDEFNVTDFSKEVFSQPEVIEAFNNYKEDYKAENEIALEESFDISEQAVKKQSRDFKSVIKLDKNFHIYIHGNRQNIVKGYDEATGRNFYQIFYNEEK